MAGPSGHGGEERGSRISQAELESVEHASVERVSAEASTSGQSESYTPTDIVFRYRTDGIEQFKDAATNVSGLV